MTGTPRFGFLVWLEARPGREDDVVDFLERARTLVDAEPGTRTWYAFRSGPTTFGIFNSFDTEAGRDVHLSGEVRAALERFGAELFSAAPVITPVDVVTSKPRARE
jgi:quinol monooxygenase YgiN